MAGNKRSCRIPDDFLKGTWTVKGKATEERGLAIFVFEGKPLQLARIQRENPFKQPE